MMRRGLILMLLVGLGACDPAPRATGPADQDPASRVGPEVGDRIERQGDARVVIALDPSTLSGGAGATFDRRRLQRQVGDLVDGFVGRVGAGDLDGIRRFEAVPAVVGTVRSASALARLAADPGVVRIDLDVGGRGGLVQSVPQIGADTRHERGNDGAGVVAAILDTGIQSSHPSLAGRVVHQACFGATSSGGFCPNGSDRQVGGRAGEDDAGHGTHVAGIVASDGTVGDPGVAPGAALVSIKVTDDCDFAGCFYFFSEIVAALDYLITHQETLDVSVINMSLGTGAQFTGVCDQSTSFNMAGSQAINTLRQMGVLAFAASMNTGSSTEMASPACLENVIAVAAVDYADQIAPFSNINEATALLAPGVNIASLARGGGTTTASGTSMAAPHAAGCAALLFQASPDRPAADILARLLSSAVQVTDQRNGVTLPRLDCQAGVDPTDPRGTVEVGRPGTSP